MEKMEKKVIKLLVKWGSNEKDAAKMVEENLSIAIACVPSAPASYYAEFVRSV